MLVDTAPGPLYGPGDGVTGDFAAAPHQGLFGFGLDQAQLVDQRPRVLDLRAIFQGPDLVVQFSLAGVVPVVPVRKKLL